MRPKRNSQTFQKHSQRSVAQPRKGPRSIASSSKSVRSACSPSRTSYSFPKHHSDVQYKKCPHASKNQLSPTTSAKNSMMNTPDIKDKQETNQVTCTKCHHTVQNVSVIKNEPKTPTVGNINSGLPNVSEIKKKNEIKNMLTNLNTKPPKENSISSKSTVAEASKPCESNVNKNAIQPQISCNVPQHKHIVTPMEPRVELVMKNIKNLPPPPKVGQVNKNVKPLPPPQKVQPSFQSVKTPNPAPPNDDKITEIYKRPREIAQDSEGKLYTESIIDENQHFQSVTRELANIIKNFQKQIHDVPTSKAKMEEVPSSMILLKNKEFFKNEPAPEVKTPRSKTPTKTSDQNLSKKSSVSKPPIQPKTSHVFSNAISKQASWRKLSTSSISSKSSEIRRFHSMTQHNLMVSKSSSHRRMHSTSQNIDPLKQLKEEVHKAIRDHKTFTVRGQYSPIRKALLARGWVEKFHMSYRDQLSEDMKKYQNYSINELLPLTRREDLTTTCKNLIKSKLLGGYQVDFYWGTNDEAFKENPDKIKLTLINKLKREIFSYTNKQGLCEASKLSYWYQKRNVSKLNHPRSYSLGKNGDIRGFTEDFNLTAAMSLLKWVVKMNITKECKLLSPSGKIPLETFDFAVNECCKFIKKAKHEDIDVQIHEASENEWNKFLDYFYKIVHYSNHFKNGPKETEDSMVRKSNYVLNTLKNFYPYVDMDGMMNIWILKPTASSRGRGIHMCRTLQYVLKTVRQNSTVRYIIQKYIERPLLIYNTKFDIRQWFLISNCSPLTIWMYKECYLRFSSQTYNLRKLHESIHLTNNSVQCKYKNALLDTALPSYNMWDSSDFQKYLTNIGYPNAYKNIIYPGMKQCVTAAVLMHHDKMMIRKNCFELYGADFILTEDFQPWLLEINSNPALFASTPVTARMCPKVLDDVIKVVIDYPHNSKADTGLFELVYREQVMKLPQTSNLEVRGLPLRRSYFAPDEEMQGTVQQCETPIRYQDPLKNFGEEIKRTLKNLLQIIQTEKKKRGMDNKSRNLVVA